MRAALTALLLATLAGCADGTERPPNFIVILCDNLGYGDTEPFGSTLHRTPHLSRMAREGRTLTHFYASAGVCTPSRASLLTGCYAQRVGMHATPRDGHVLRPVSPYGINPDETTVAETLRERGYATALVGKWHLGDQPEFLPTRHGFDSYFGIPYSDDMTEERGRRLERFQGHRWPPLPLMENETVIEAPVDRNQLTMRYTERALEFIEANRDRPFFLLLSHAMPGSEREPFASEAFRGRSRNGAWGDAVEELDWSAGQVLDKLVATGLDAHTLVFWTSDNGAPLAADPSSPARGSNLPLHGRGYTTAEGGFRVPAIAWWPGTIPAGSETAELTSMLDVLPTLSSISGQAVSTDRAIDGMDIRGALLGHGEARSPRQDLYYYFEDQLQAVRSGPWKLFVALEEPGPRHPHFDQGGPDGPALFNVVDDPGCLRDLAADRPDIVAQLDAIADEARSELGDHGRPGSGQRPPGIVDMPTPVILQP